MKIREKLKTLTLTAALTVCGIAAAVLMGCGSKEEIEPIKEASVVSEGSIEPIWETSVVSEESIEENEISYPYTVVDQAGRTVTITKKFERVAFSSVRPLPAAYFAVTGTIDNIVGMNPSSRSAALASMFTVLCPEIGDIETGFVEGNDTNIEELMKLEPDVVFCLNKNTDEIAALEAVGITAIALETNGTDPIELFASWAELIGQVMGEQNRAEALINYSREVAAKIKETASTIPEEEKKKVIFIYNNDNDKLTVGGGDLYSQYWATTVGAKNAASDCSNVAAVSMEQIMAWNPDYIFITTFTSCMPEDIYNNTIEGQDWSNIKAVQDGNVYKDPLGIYRWFTPTADSSLMLQWVAQTIYPEYYSDYDITEVVKDFYKTYYNYELKEEEIDMIFNPSTDAAYYSGK